MNKHIAASGKDAGKWVKCDAVVECRNGGVHASSEELKQVVEWWNTKTGRQKTSLRKLSEEQVTRYLSLPDNHKEEIINELEFQELKRLGQGGITFENLAKLNTHQRWQLAGSIVKQSGVKFRNNVVSCCRGCITKEQLGMTDEKQPVAYTFGGQGNRISWDRSGEAISKSTRKTRWGNEEEAYGDIYINHDNGAAPIVVDALRKAGFEVEWDGTEYQAICVKTL